MGRLLGSAIAVRAARLRTVTGRRRAACQ